MPYQTAIFDLDGTLLDTLEDLYRAVNHALRRHEQPLRTRDEIRSFVGNGVELLVRRSLPKGYTEETASSVLSDFKTTYAAVCKDNTKPYEGILPLLSTLRERGIRIAVVSNKFDAATKALCAEYFGKLVEVAVGERADIRKKPSPDTVFEALTALGVTADGAVYIGDSEVDIQTAKNCDMDCISVTWGFKDTDFLLANDAKTLAHTPDQLLGLLLS